MKAKQLLILLSAAALITSCSKTLELGPIGCIEGCGSKFVKIK